MKHLAIFLMTVLLAVGGCTRQEDGVGRVGEDVITRAEFLRVLDRKVRLSGENGANDRLKAETANLLVERKLLAREGERRGIRLAEADIEAEMAKYRSSYTDEKLYRAQLERDGLTPELLRREIAETLMAERMRGVLAGGVTVDEAEARAVYEKSRADFSILPLYRVQLVHVESAQVGEAVAKGATIDPASFERLALVEAAPELRRMNQMAPLSPRDQFPAGLFPLLDRLQPGSVGGPVKTARGWFVVKLLERTGGRQLSWEESRNQVLHMLYQEKKDGAVESWLAAERGRVKVELHPEKF